MSEQLGFTIQSIDEMISGYEDSLRRLNIKLTAAKREVSETEEKIAGFQQRLDDLQASRAVLVSVQTAAQNAAREIGVINGS